MTSEEKFDLLVSFYYKSIPVKITVASGEVFFCRLRGIAEGEDDLAFGIITLEKPPRHFILECNYITDIEKLNV